MNIFRIRIIDNESGEIYWQRTNYVIVDPVPKRNGSVQLPLLLAESLQSFLRGLLKHKSLSFYVDSQPYDNDKDPSFVF